MTLVPAAATPEGPPAVVRTVPLGVDRPAREPLSMERRAPDV
jgi:hypothetical protein